MTSLDFNLAKLLIWLHLRQVPLELFTRSGLSYIASAIGVPLYMDRITASFQRLAYAKVCVEIDVTSEIPSTIEVRMKDGSPVSITVEVPWHPQRCTNCSLFGYSSKTCQRKPAVVTKTWVPKQVKRTVHEKKEEVVYGSNDGKEMKKLWSHLQEVEEMYKDAPWLLEGDFNVSIHPEESSNYYEGQTITMEMQKFVDCRNQIVVYDHAAAGPLYT
ncbi:hypothetical protein DITRI_Ditri12bG0061700 [Diplodiscus trichospermus]